ncbi:O-acetylhomoserine aminocarboxypropyltransferase/cysteine synthase [Rhizophagus irregularis DAOM 181602=DAOM 197198]|uniref:Uncharacterized protein n=2 Tax=Rhizophagus irregularis TaxID=588596 RepID=U9UCU6_RHIID|nr:hypothetical protein GLOIN_2v1874591 [Rhizophagus irregularis DAOM 181602=DAOM 197198]EXX79506.1 bifunctional cysteine synthase/O-acetylhomoserine aminocarboxypropyltransferase MET17 [Rhizophagus irregularis DAOM 197198w]POG73184.1 hypothetical protein GLOIN_2v1874591 [Rhizophagus irregularis DAOM 181602=DAOM 197198]GBC14708.1 O-acetylhomoserine aminocarboxypropyltransferase/cysteine synthase [Rhizophagus irregularis DAOM 181602=DAOM 197198]|eukprot:XP_025180050.1 hypothetical protein GLOIN_2v1874591 [Rhizophagus irregularis DAOM 181602=DAOM 197198]
MSNIGPRQDPFGSFLLIQGLETLSLRVCRQAESALVVRIESDANVKAAFIEALQLASKPFDKCGDAGTSCFKNNG